MSSSFRNPVETTKVIVTTAESKNSTTISNLILSSFLTRAYIIFNCLLVVLTSTRLLDASMLIGLEKFVFNAVFPVEFMVVLAGSELFTGNVIFMTS